MSAPTKSIALFIAFLTGILLTIIVAFLLQLGFNPDTPMVMPGSCNNDTRPHDTIASASVVNQGIGIEMINNFGTRFYGTPFTSVIRNPDESRRNVITGSGLRIGAFISKYMLDAIFEADMESNGIMCYAGSNASGGLEYFITPAKRSSNASPNMPPIGTPILFQLSATSWCPTVCNDLP